MTESEPAAELQETRREPASDALTDFIEQMGLLFEHDNHPRIAGRLLGLFLAEEGPFSLRALADRLRVSRGSISTNARMLTNAGVLDRVALPGDRQDYYRLARNPFERLLTGRAAAFRRIAAVLDEAAESFPEDRQAATARLRTMADFHRAAADSITELIERSAKQRH